MFDAWHSFYMVHRKAANVLTADMAVGTHKVDSLIKLLPYQIDMLSAAGFSNFVYQPFLYPEGKARDIYGDEVLDF